MIHTLGSKAFRGYDSFHSNNTVVQYMYTNVMLQCIITVMVSIPAA